jgi:hypothetical protein
MSLECGATVDMIGLCRRTDLVDVGDNHT